jgi:hypothetical protein
MKRLVKTAGWKIFLAIVIVSFALFISAFQLSDNLAVVFIPTIVSGLFYYAWMYGLAACFEERDRTFVARSVKVASVVALLGFLCAWILPYQTVNHLPYEALPRAMRVVSSLLCLVFYPTALYASYVLTRAGLCARRGTLKVGFLSVAPRALVLTLLPVFAWPFFHARFRKLFTAS